VANWSFLTNHARVLLSIAHDPGVRLRDIAASLGITERSAYGIVTDLAEVGYVVKQKDDRRNSPDPGAPAAARTHPAGTRRRRSPGSPCRHRRRAMNGICRASARPQGPGGRPEQRPGVPLSGPKGRPIGRQHTRRVQA